MSARVPAAAPARAGTGRLDLLRRAGRAFDAAGIGWTVVAGVAPATGAVATDAEIVADARSLDIVTRAIGDGEAIAIVKSLRSGPDTEAFWICDRADLAAGRAAPDESDLLQLDVSLSLRDGDRTVAGRVVVALGVETANGLPMAGARAVDLYRHAKAAGRRRHGGWGEIVRRWRRIRRPAGVCVCLLGPDGVGKSTVAAALEAATRSMYAAPVRHHLRPFFGRPDRLSAPATATPHRLPPRSAPATAAKLLLWWLDATAGFWIAVTPALIRNRLVLFDRYYHDILVDPRRYRVAHFRALAGALGRLVEHPHLTIVLDAPPAEIRRRKAELPEGELARQREAYLKLAASLPGAAVVDATQPVADVVARIAAHLRAIEHGRRT